MVTLLKLPIAVKAVVKLLIKGMVVVGAPNKHDARTHGVMTRGTSDCRDLLACFEGEGEADGTAEAPHEAHRCTAKPAVSSF